ncbi:HAMP domain-containing protein [Siculibacillus lacustris]|uniref:HAMP domain-containing protein n=1 Tax=Siculibacillus lacustris TaxID=1549641 RepID=A0A4Q9VSP5_9HYPH|nr:HAMP domain-containing methyl-accepting chemotaxis protein [Siculibacillus lacustris]TBW38686.1 HAMP domain-containing protein [Siculibacillus lacustris]
MVSSFSNLSLRLQVGAIVLVVLAGLGVVGAVYLDGRSRQTASLGEAAVASALDARAQTLEIDLLQMRRAEKNFIIRSDAAYARENATIRARAEENLAGLVRELGNGRHAVVAPKVETIVKGVKAYGTAFETLVAARGRLGLDPNAGLEGSLRKAAHEVEAQLESFDDLALKVQLLQMRRSEKDYMLRHDPKIVELFASQAKAFEARLMAVDAPLATRTAITQAVDLYRRSVLAWIDGDHEMAVAEKAMQQTHRAMEPVIDDVEKTVQAIAAAAKADADATTAATDRSLLWTFAAIVAALVVASAAIGRAISKPIGTMTEVMTRLADGDLEVAVAGREKTNEIGRMARAVEIFRDNAREQRRLEAAQAGEAARVAAERRRAMMDLADAFERQVGGVVSMVSSAATELETAAQSLSASAEEASTQSTAVASASEEASANVQSVAASTEELATTVREVGRQVERSASIAGRAMTEATEATTRVHGLSGAAERIGSIVQLIAEIAGKTNLLALNATIEAARAGEAGRGFAVVAAEVKGLADQTAKATAQIGTQVDAIQASTGEAATAIGGIGRTIETMNTIAGTIAAAVEEQGAATQEIARNVAQAARGASEVSSNIAGVSDASASSSAGAAQVLAAAQDLGRQSEALRGAVGTFLADVRAA